MITILVNRYYNAIRCVSQAIVVVCFWRYWTE